MRHTALVFLLLAFAQCAASCVVEVDADSSKPQVQVAPIATPRLEFIERLMGDATVDESVPTIIAIHGLGDTPENFARVFGGLSLRSRIILPRAPLTHHGGFAWTRARIVGGDARALDEDIDRRVNELVELLEHLAARPEIDRPFIVTGFSQGGILTYALTLAHPSLVRAAFPIGGTLPRGRRENLPKAPRDAPRILAFHGDADSIVPYAEDRALVDALRAGGWPAELHTAEGVGHSIPPSMRRAVYDAIEISVIP
jgi:phospholipase/carboxylesterase